MPKLNWNLKALLVEQFGSQISAANQIGIAQNRMSYIIRGHIQPSDRERRALERALGLTVVKKLLKSSPRSESNKGVNANVK